MAANVNNYIAAGNAAVRSAVGIRNSLAASAPDYGAMGQTAVAEEAKSRANKKANKAQTQATQERADTDVEVNDIRIKSDEKVRNTLREGRKAGMLAGGVAMIGASQLMNRRKQEPNAQLALIKEQQEYYANLNRKSLEEAAEIDSQLSSRSSGNSSSSSSESSSSSDGFSPSSGETTSQNYNVTGGTPAWTKLGNTIAFGEGTTGANGYNTQFTGTLFDGFNDHPRQLRSGGGYTSDASGKYQFLSTTWDGAAKALNLPDFSPQSQEQAGRWLTQKRGVDPDKPITNIQDFKVAIDKLAPEWASLPTASTGTSYYGQGGKSLESLWEFYQSQ